MPGTTARERRAIISLVKDLDALSPAEFESVAHDLVCSLEGAELIHRGTTIRNHPVGYSLDTFNVSGTIVAEYGTGQDYFSAPLDKLEADIKHAKKIEPEHRLLYLMSNQQCPQGQWREVTAIVRKHYPDPKVSEARVLDARLTAEALYRELTKKPRLADHFAPLIDTAETLKTDFAFERALPPRPARCVSRKVPNQSLSSLLAQHGIVGAIGLSGAGKTFVALDLCHQIKDAYEQTLWVEGVDFKPTSLEGLNVQRLGQTVNLLGRLRESRALLIVDNWVGSTDELDALKAQIEALSNGTRVLLTSQQNLTIRGIPSVLVEEMTIEETREILSGGGSEPVPDDVVRRAHSEIGGFPIVLAIAREIVVAGDGTWSDIDHILQQAPSLERDGLTILERLLRPELGMRQSDLAALAVVGGGSVEPKLLRHMLGPSILYSMRQRCLVVEGTRGALSIHELVASAARVQSTEAMLDEQQARLWDYFAKNVLQRPPHYVRSIHRFSRQLEEKALAENRPSCLTRAFLDLEIAIRSPLIDSLAGTDLTTLEPDRCAIGCVVEALEIRWRRDKSSWELKSQVADKLGSALVGAADHYDDPEILEYLFYHAAKFHLFAGNREECLRLLEKCDQAALGTRLQQVRCLRELGRSSEAVQILGQLLVEVRRDPGGVPPTMALAFFSELGREEFEELLQPHLLSDTTLFFELVEDAIADGNGHPYDAAVTLARRIGYEYPDFLVEVCRRIALPEPSPKSRRLNKAVGALELLRATHAEYDGDPKMALHCAAAAFEYLNLLVDGEPSGTPRDRARCLELMDRGEEALRLLKKIPEPDVFEVHAIGRVCLRLGDLTTALTLAEQVVGESQADSKLSQYKSAFLAFRGDVQQKTGDTANAISSWKEASRLTKSMRFSRHLLSKISNCSVFFGTLLLTLQNIYNKSSNFNMF